MSGKGKGSGRDRDRDSDGKKTGSHNYPGKAKLNEIIDKIETDIKNFAKELEIDQKSENDITKMKNRLVTQLERLSRLEKEFPVAFEAMDINKKIAALKEQVNEPNRPQPSVFPQEQQARAAAADVVMHWGEVTPGVSLNDLTADAKERLMACTTEGGSPFQSVLNAMIQKLEGENKEPLAYLNFAIALFQAMVPQFCGQNIPTISQVEQNENNVRDLLECIAIVACNKCQEPVNPLAVFGEAAFQRPEQFFKDAAGVGFALGVLAEMVPTAVGLAQQVPSTLFQLGKYMVTNPLASFTTYHVAEPYIKSLLQKVFGERFGRGQNQVDLDERRIRDLFDELSEHYLREGVTDIIGFPPADIDSVRNKLSQILYKIEYRSVASMQSTGVIVSAARSFPGELCKRVMSTGSAIKKLLCGNGMRLLDRYKFIPQGTEEGLFESILRELDRKGLLEYPHIDAFVIAYLKHNQPTTVFHQSVKYATAQRTLIDEPLLSAADMSDSLRGEVDPNSQKEEMEEFGYERGTDLQAQEREISAEPNMGSSNADELGRFRARMQPGILRAHNEQIAARQKDEENPQRLADRVQGTSAALQSRSFAQGGVASSVFNSGPGPRTNTYPGAPQSGSAQGGRSRSRKRSISKRTRRKGVAKKQNSKKNKRQSRRKVRRASSRKGRK